MKKIIELIKTLPLVLLLLIFTGSGHAKSEQNGLAVKFFGLGTAGVISQSIAEAMQDSNIDVTGFDCFQLPVLDPASEKKRGIGVDCLRPISVTGDAKGEGLQMEAITFFFLKGGIIVNHGCTSIRPFFEGVGDAGVTHMTGSIGASEFGTPISANSPEVCTNQGIIFGTGQYRDMKGEARLSGAVNLSNASNGQIRFSCLFVLRLNKE